MSDLDLDVLHHADALDRLSEMELLDLYLRVRTMLARRLATTEGSESLEMFFSRVAEVVDPGRLAVQPAAPATPAVRITPREREVLHFLAQDASNADIAAALFLSIFTVKRHVASILTKYDVRTRYGAVMAAVRDGTLTID